jgi:dCMP deaminase
MISKREMKWHLRFLMMAQEVAGWSKDSTQVGAVIVDQDELIISTGYNGFPKEIRDTVNRLQDRELKNHMVVHAEMNAIFNARDLHFLKGSTIYVYGVPPCTTCTSAIIRNGISRIVIFDECVKNCHEPWESRWKISLQMLSEAHVKVILI